MRTSTSRVLPKPWDRTLSGQGIGLLLGALTAGTIVTRVTGGRDIGLGRDIAEQLVSDPRALRLAAAVLLGMAAIPGFPAPIFLVLAAVG